MKNLIQDNNVSYLKIEIPKTDNNSFTHVVYCVNRKDEHIKKVLYNSRSEEIYREIEIHPNPKIKCESADLRNISKEELIKLVNKGVKACIASHGDITKEYVTSASKRIAGEIFRIFKNKQ
jgi:hypothetical protein